MATVDNVVDEVIDARPRDNRAQNPALDYAPVWRSHVEALKQLTFDPERTKSGLMSSDGLPNFPTAAQPHLVYELVRSITHSRLERNPADPVFQTKLYDVSTFLATSEDIHGRRVNSPVIAVPTSGARGIWVSIPAGHGERAVVNAVERYIGTSAHRFYVSSSAGGEFDISIVKSITVPFPETGSPRAFIDTFLKQMDSAVNDGCSTHRTGPFRREPDDVVNAMCGLAIQHNLGALLVPGLTREAVKGKAGGVLLGMLARFTALSGIPVVCFATTAATTAAEVHGSAVRALRKVGISIIALQETDREWGRLTRHFWEHYFSYRFSHDMPAWLYTELWRHTLGLLEPALKLAEHAYGKGEFTRESELTVSLLEQYARDALELDVGMLTSLRFVLSKEALTRGSGFRADHADSFPLQVNIEHAPVFNEVTVELARTLIDGPPPEGKS